MTTRIHDHNFIKVKSTMLVFLFFFSVPEFLTKMRQLRGYHGFSRTVSQRLTSLERNFLVVSPLYIKFEKYVLGFIPGQAVLFILINMLYVDLKYIEI